MIREMLPYAKCDWCGSARYVELEIRGKRWVGLCGDCLDRTPRDEVQRFVEGAGSRAERKGWRG